MKKGNVYLPDSSAHPYLDFVCCIDPKCQRLACCSAFLVSPRHVISAAHCFNKCKNLEIRFINDSMNEIVSYRQLGRMDAAICKLKHEVKDIKPLTVSQDPLSPNDLVAFAGWGSENSSSSLSRLKWSFSSVDHVHKNGTVKLKTDPFYGQVAMGDSGGPLISFKKGLAEASGVIVKVNNVAVSLWPFEKGIPRETLPVELTDEALERLFEIDLDRDNILSDEKEPSLDIQRSVEHWIIKKQDGNS